MYIHIYIHIYIYLMRLESGSGPRPREHIGGTLHRYHILRIEGIRGYGMGFKGV
jgi:hypothetical protein